MRQKSIADFFKRPAGSTTAVTPSSAPPPNKRPRNPPPLNQLPTNLTAATPKRHKNGAPNDAVESQADGVAALLNTAHARQCALSTQQLAQSALPSADEWTAVDHVANSKTTDTKCTINAARIGQLSMLAPVLAREGSVLPPVALAKLWEYALYGGDAAHTSTAACAALRTTAEAAAGIPVHLGAAAALASTSPAPTAAVARKTARGPRGTATRPSQESSEPSQPEASAEKLLLDLLAPLHAARHTRGRLPADHAAVAHALPLLRVLARVCADARGKTEAGYLELPLATYRVFKSLGDLFDATDRVLADVAAALFEALACLRNNGGLVDGAAAAVNDVYRQHVQRAKPDYETVAAGNAVRDQARKLLSRAPFRFLQAFGNLECEPHLLIALLEPRQSAGSVGLDASAATRVSPFELGAAAFDSDDESDFVPATALRARALRFLKARPANAMGAKDARRLLPVQAALIRWFLHTLRHKAEEMGGDERASASRALRQCALHVAESSQKHIGSWASEGPRLVSEGGV